MVALRHYLYVADTACELNETSLRQRLKRETAAVHQHLEAQLGLLDPGLDMPRYLRVLGTFYGFYVRKNGMKLQNKAGTPPINIPLLYICEKCGTMLTIPPPNSPGFDT